MTGQVIQADGAAWELPALTGWELRWTQGLPCDSFAVRFAATALDAARLQKAVRFRASENGTVWFTGVVDEYEIALGPSGLTGTVTGRGMAALLLDNEAGTAEYDRAQLEQIVTEYVSPFGIALGEHIALPALTSFGVDSGDSCWAAVYGFARWAGGVMPRFDTQGRLVLLPDGAGKQWRLEDGAPVLEAVFTDRRYGVISEIVEHNRSTGRRRVVQDKALIAEGGQCRRVMSVYSKTAHRASARTAEQAMALSAMDRRVLELTLPVMTEAMPGDSVSVTLERMGVTGRFIVAEKQAALTGQGLRCTLSLRTW